MCGSPKYKLQGVLCVNMNEICQGMKKLWPMLSFLQVFDLEKGQCEGQGQVYVRQSEVLVVRSVMCKYERNPSRNEKVMANVKFFYNYLTLRKVNVKVKVRFMCGSLRY